MQLLIEPNEKRAYPSLSDDRPVRFPELRQGEILPLTIGLVNRIRFPFDGTLFAPIAAPDDFRVALGLGFLLPFAGTFTLLDGDELNYNPTATEIETALNAITAIDDAGGVAVNGFAGFFVITWNEVGAQTLLTGDPGDLEPLSVLSILRAAIGDADTREVQTLRIYQSAGAIATIETAVAVVGVAVTTVVAGGAGVNMKVRVTFTGDIYGGTWTFSAGNPVEESDPLEYDWTAARLQTALESVGTIGVENVSVVQETEQQYLITFVGALAGTAVANISVDGSGLLGLELLTGLLDLRAQGVDQLLNGDSDRVVTFEVQSETTAGPRKILDQDVVLNGGVIETGMTDTGSPGSNSPIVLVGITNFVGGTASDLDSVATVSIDPDSGIPYLIRVNGQFVVVYLESGPADVGDPGQIAPLDYDAGTNDVHWTRG